MKTDLKIHVIAPALPPQLDGIGDYTAHLAAELAHFAEVKALTVQGQAHAAIPGVAIEPTFSVEQPDSVMEFARRIEADPPDWVLLQYQPFSYGRWGLNLSLPRVMEQIKRRQPEMRFALMVHEPFVPVDCWQNAVMTTWQRWQLWALGRTADTVFFSIEAWTKKFASWFPGKPVLHLPVGSNIPLVPTARGEARARLGIAENTLILGLFGTAHNSRLMEPTRRAAEAARSAGQDAQVLYIGPQVQAVRAALGDIPLIADGALPPDEVSRRFAAMDVYFAAYADGVSTRRGALMAGLQHGAAIVGTRGALTDGILNTWDGRAFLLADVNAPDEMDAQAQRLLHDAALRQQMGEGARQLYREQFAWDKIAARLLQTVTGRASLRALKESIR